MTLAVLVALFAVAVMAATAPTWSTRQRPAAAVSAHPAAAAGSRRRRVPLMVLPGLRRPDDGDEYEGRHRPRDGGRRVVDIAWRLHHEPRRQVMALTSLADNAAAGARALTLFRDSAADLRVSTNPVLADEIARALERRARRAASWPAGRRA